MLLQSKYVYIHGPSRNDTLPLVLTSSWVETYGNLGNTAKGESWGREVVGHYWSFRQFLLDMYIFGVPFFSDTQCMVHLPT